MYGYVAPRSGYAVMYGPGRVPKALGREFVPENREWALEQLATWLGLRGNSAPVTPKTALGVVGEFEKLTGLEQESKWVRGLSKRAIALYLSTDCDLTAESLEDRISAVHASSGLRASTLRKRAQYFEKFVKWCISKRYLDRNPFASIKAPKVEYKGFAPFTEDEVLRLREHLANTGREVYGVAVHFLYLTALRSGELVSMKREHVLPDSFLIVGKGSKDRQKRLRYFPLKNGDRILFPDVLELLSVVQKNTYVRRSDYVWPWTTTAPLQREFRKACEECNIWITRVGIDGQRYKRTIHTLRGSCEKRWEGLGFSDTLIEDLAGHSGRVRKQHYREATQAATDLALRISQVL